MKKQMVFIMVLICFIISFMITNARDYLAVTVGSANHEVKLEFLVPNLGPFLHAKPHNFKF